jgi:hypothetical protein
MLTAATVPATGEVSRADASECRARIRAACALSIAAWSRASVAAVTVPAPDAVPDPGELAAGAAPVPFTAGRAAVAAGADDLVVVGADADGTDEDGADADSDDAEGPVAVESSRASASIESCAWCWAAATFCWAADTVSRAV